KKLIVFLITTMFIGAGIFTFSVVEHTFGQLKINDAITGDEKNAADALKSDGKKLPIRALFYNYFDTIHYYTGKSDIVEVQPNELPTYPAYFITQTAFIKANPIPAQIISHFSLLYQGFFITLYTLNP